MRLTCNDALRLLNCGIDIWPDYWAAPPRTAGRTFQILSKFDEPEAGCNCAPAPRAYRQ